MSKFKSLWLEALPLVALLLLCSLDYIQGSFDHEDAEFEEIAEKPDIPFFDCARNSLISATDDEGEKHATIFPRITTSACSPDFQYCSEGIALPATCPAGLFFSPTIYDCEQKERIEWCGEEGAAERNKLLAKIKKTRPLEEDVPHHDCLRKPCGFYPDERVQDGSSFVFCKAGEEIIKPCPEGSAFDYTKGDCVLKDEAKVWTTPEVIPGNYSRNHPLKHHDAGELDGVPADTKGREFYVPVYSGIKGFPPPAANPVEVDFQTEAATIMGNMVTEDEVKKNEWIAHWTEWLMCPDLSFILEFNATDGMECNHPGTGGKSAFVLEFPSPVWNAIRDFMGDPGAVINGMKVTYPPKTGADGKADNVQFFFSNKPPEGISDNAAVRENEQYCPIHTAGCGLTIRVARKETDPEDQVNILNAKIECCPVSSPFEEPGYSPVEYMREVVRCDNTNADVWRKCKFTVGIFGLVVPDELLHVGSFYASVGYTLEKIYKDVEKRVQQKGVKCGGDDEGDEEEPPSCWYEGWKNLTLETARPIQLKRTVSVPPHTTLVLYQAYAQVGYMRIFSPRFLEVIETNVVEYPMVTEVLMEDIEKGLAASAKPGNDGPDPRDPVIAEMTPEATPNNGDQELVCKYHAQEASKRYQRDGLDAIIISTQDNSVTGKWKTWSNCSGEGHVIDRFQFIKEEVTWPNGKKDQAGVVQFGGKCTDINLPDQKKEAPSDEVQVLVPGGDQKPFIDTNWRVCKDGVAVGFQILRREKEKAKIDDMGMETIKILCSCQVKEYWGDPKGEGITFGRGKLGMGGYKMVEGVFDDTVILTTPSPNAEPPKEEEGDGEKKKKKLRVSKPARTEGVFVEKGKKIKAPRMKKPNDSAAPLVEGATIVFSWRKKQMPGVPPENRTKVLIGEPENQKAEDDALTEGIWGERQICKPDQALVGIRPKFLELLRHRDGYDNKGLLAFKGKCMDIPMYPRLCEPSEKKIVVAKCTNPRGQDASCKFQSVVGVTYDYTEENRYIINTIEGIGASLPCVLSDLRLNFGKKLGPTHQAWSDVTSRSIWNTITTMYGILPKVPPGASLDVEQYVGVCGPYVVYTNRYDMGGTSYILPHTAYETLLPSIQQCWRDTEPLKMKPTPEGKIILGLEKPELEPRSEVPRCRFREADPTDDFSEVDGGIVITSPQINQNGFWGDDHHMHHPKEAPNGWYTCPQDSYVNGIIVQRFVENNDEFGVAHMSFKCIFPKNGTDATWWTLKTPGLPEQTVKPLKTWHECREAAVAIGFQLNSQATKEDDEDDVATDNVLLECSCGRPAVDDFYEDDHFGPFLRGEWTPPRICQPRQALCGFQGQFEHYYRPDELEETGMVIDNTGLNNLKGKCCDVKHPAEKCNPEERKVVIGHCDNLDDAKDRSCLIMLAVGIRPIEEMNPYEKQFYEGIGHTEECTGGLLRPRFQSNVKCSGEGVSEDFVGSPCQYDWTTAPHQIWGHLDTYHDKAEIKGSTKANISQIIGVCGNYQVLTNRYVVDEEIKDLVDLSHPLHHDGHHKKCWADDKPIKSKSTGGETMQPDTPKKSFDLSTSNLTVFDIEKDGSVMTSPVETDFPELSNYSEWVYCKPPENGDSWYVDGIYVERQGTPPPMEDLSGLVAIALRCGNTKKIQRGEHIIQGVTPGVSTVDVGAWDWRTCKCGAAVGFQVSSVPTQLLADDLAVESMKVKCSCDAEWIWKTKDEFPQLLQGLRGSWTGEQLCRPREAICGMQIKAKPFQLPSDAELEEAGLQGYDNIGITKVKVKCCAVPNPALMCTPKESIREIAVCDNTEHDIKKRCRIDTIIGVTYDIANLEAKNEADFLESVGWSLKCIVDELEENFVEKLGKSDLKTDYLWIGARDIWTEAQAVVDFVDMDEGSKSAIHQIVGECGPYIVATDRFLRRDNLLKADEADIDEEFYDSKQEVKPMNQIRPGCWADMARYNARDFVFPNASNEIAFHALDCPNEFTAFFTDTRSGIVLEAPPTKTLLKMGQTDEFKLDDDGSGRVQKRECPEGSYITGFAHYSTLIEKKDTDITQRANNEGAVNGTQDDLGVTHLMIRCRKPDRDTKAKGLSVFDASTDVNLNKLRNLHMPCLGGLLIGIQVSYMPIIPKGLPRKDRTGIDNIKMICSWGPPLINLDPPRHNWTELFACQAYQAFCEVTAVFGEKSSGNWKQTDGAGLVQLRMGCCDVPSPVAGGTPKEILRLTATCDNTQFTEERICDFTLDLGVTYDFQEHKNEAVSFLSIGYSIPCIVTSVKFAFQKAVDAGGGKLECALAADEGQCVYDWPDALEADRIFQAGVTTYANSTLTKGEQRVDIYQVAGKVNNVLVLTNHFVFVTRTVDGKELDRRRVVYEVGRFPKIDAEKQVCNLTDIGDEPNTMVTREETPLMPINKQVQAPPPKDADDEGEEVWMANEVDKVIPVSPPLSTVGAPPKPEEDQVAVGTPDDDDGFEIFMDAQVDGERPWFPPVVCPKGSFIVMAAAEQLLDLKGDPPIRGVHFECRDPPGNLREELQADSVRVPPDPPLATGIKGIPAADYKDLKPYEVCLCPGTRTPQIPTGMLATIVKDESGGKVTNLTVICSCDGENMQKPFDMHTIYEMGINLTAEGRTVDDDEEEMKKEDEEVELAKVKLDHEKLGPLPPGDKIFRDGPVRKLALYCPPRKGLCGVRVQAKHKKKGGVQKLQTHCCDIPPPSDECKPEDKLVKAVNCDNMFNQLDRVCEFDMLIGITYDLKEYDGFRKFYDRMKWNLVCVNDRLATKLGDALGETKSATPFNWDSSSKENPLGQEWKELRVGTWKIPTPPMTRIELFQTVGRCGMYVIYTDEVFVVETNSETGEVKKYNKQMKFGEDEGDLKLAPGTPIDDPKCWIDVVPIYAITPILTDNEPPASLTGNMNLAKVDDSSYEKIRGPPGHVEFHAFPASPNGIPVYPGDEKEEVTGMWYYFHEGNQDDETWEDETKVLCKAGSYVRRFGAFPPAEEDGVMNAMYFVCTNPEETGGDNFQILMTPDAPEPENKYPVLAHGIFIGMNTKPKSPTLVGHAIPVGSIKKKVADPAVYPKVEYCPPGMAVCGFHASWGPEGAKNAKFLCCSVDSPGQFCTPKERTEVAAICDNRGETRKRKCVIRFGVGIMYNIKNHAVSSLFHGSVGYVPNCIAEDVKRKYQLMECKEGEGCKYQWGSAPHEVWRHLEIVENVTTEVEPNQMVEYRQIVGGCMYEIGEVLVLTPSLTRVALDSALQELTNDPIQITDVPNKDRPAECPWKFLNLTVPPTPSPLIDESPILETSANMPENDTSELHPFHGMQETELIEFSPEEAIDVIIPGPRDLELRVNLFTEWGQWMNCSEGKYVKSLEIYSGGLKEGGSAVEYGKKGVRGDFKDSMGFVAMGAKCVTPKMDGEEELMLYSVEGQAPPAERESKACAEGAAAMGFEARFVHYNTPPQDNLAYTNYKQFCSFSDHLMFDEATDEDKDIGEWVATEVCRPREALCGFWLEGNKFESTQPITIHDNVGIGSLKAKCCPVESPARVCTPQAAREDAIVCDNTPFDNDRQCVGQFFIGLSYIYKNPENEKPAFYESLGWTLDCVKEELSARFAIEVGKTPDFDWEEHVIHSTLDVLDIKMWYRVVQVEKIFDVPKKTGFKIQQVTGTCGIYKVHTHHFIKVNLADNTEEPLIMEGMGNTRPDLCWADLTPLKGRNWVLNNPSKYPPVLFLRNPYPSTKENVFRFDPPDNTDRQGMMAKMPYDPLPAARWSQFFLCPVDSWIRSIAVRKEEKDNGGKKDIIGMVSLSFQCMTANMTITREETIVHPSFKDDLQKWKDAHLGKPGSRYQICLGATIGVEFQYAPVGQAGGDDFGIYDARWLCGVSKDTSFVPLPNHTPINPHLLKGLVCRPRQSLCQIQAAFAEEFAADKDNMGITNLKMACCPVPNPIATCEASEKLAYIVTCDNIKYNRVRKCKFNVGFGIQYDLLNYEKEAIFYNSVCYTPTCIADDLRDRFANWGANAPDQFFQEVVKVQRVIDIPARSKVEVYQMVGYCNQIMIYTSKLMFLEKNDDGEEVGKVKMVDKNLPPYEKKPCECPPETGELEPPKLPPPEHLKNMDAPKRPNLNCAFKDRLDAAIYILAGDGNSFIEGTREVNIEVNHREQTWNGYDWLNCSKGNYFTGFTVHTGEVEVPVEEGNAALGTRKDNYGIDALALQCTNPLKNTPEDILEHHSKGSDVKKEQLVDGKKIKGGKYCDAGAAIGFTLGIKPWQKTKDDVSVDSFRLHCSCGNELIDGKAAENKDVKYQFWTDPKFCRPKEALCGFTVAAKELAKDKTIMRHDNIGITNVRTKCCPVPSPIPDLEPKEDLVKLASCDNKGGHEMKKCTVDLYVGLAYTYLKEHQFQIYFYDTIGYTLHVVRKEIGQRFASLGTTEKYDWANAAGSNIWNKVRDRRENMTAHIGVEVILYQVVATAGFYKVRTNKFILKEINTHTNQEKEVSLEMNDIAQPAGTPSWEMTSPIRGRDWMITWSTPPTWWTPRDKYPVPTKLETLEKIVDALNQDQAMFGMIIQTPNPVLLGYRWDEWQFCPNGTFVRAWSSVAAGKQLKNDNSKEDYSGVVLIRAICMAPDGDPASFFTIDFLQHNNGWEEERWTSKGRIGILTCVGAGIGIQAKIQNVPKPTEDHFVFHDTKLVCSAGQHAGFVRDGPFETPCDAPLDPKLSSKDVQAEANKMEVCKPRQAICGLRVSWGSNNIGDHSKQDGIGVTNLLALCCEVPSPVSMCRKKSIERVVFASACDNSKSTVPRRCMFNLVVGIAYDYHESEYESFFYASNGFTPTCISGDVKQKFSTVPPKPCGEKGCGYDWTSAPIQVWQETITIAQMRDVEPHQRFRIYQVIGECDSIIVLTNQFIQVIADKDENELSRETWLVTDLPPPKQKKCEVP